MKDTHSENEVVSSSSSLEFASIQVFFGPGLTYQFCQFDTYLQEMTAAKLPSAKTSSNIAGGARKLASGI